MYQNFSLEIEAGKITAILAPSGAGKTTLLKHISNTEKLSSFLFQNPRLLPWKTILENVTLPLENWDFGSKGFSKSEIVERGEYNGKVRGWCSFFVNLLAYIKKKLYLCRLFGVRTRNY